MQAGTRVSRATVYRTLQGNSDGGQITTKSHSDQTNYRHLYTARLTDAQISDLCNDAHSKMVTGTYLWCGQAILNGKPTGGLE